MKRCFGFVLTTLLLFAAGTLRLPAQYFLSIDKITICVDFNNTGSVTLSDGTTVTATASTLTDAQKEEVLKKIKEKYEGVLGAGNATVNQAGPGGCPAGGHNVVVSGSADPKRYGNAGKAPGPSIVFGGGFAEDGVTGNELACAIGETAAHEVGHRLGLSHNCDTNDLMVSGDKLTLDLIKKDKRKFGPGDSTKIRGYKEVASIDPKPGDFAVTVTQIRTRDGISHEDALDAEVTFTGNQDVITELGFINIQNEFVSSRTNTDMAPLIFTFIYSGTYDLAVRQGRQVYPARGYATIELLDQAQGGEQLYRYALLTFDLDRDNNPDLTVRLAAHTDSSPGSGFSAAGSSVVEPQITFGALFDVEYMRGAVSVPTLRLQLDRPGDVDLRLYTTAGDEVATIVNEALQPGEHRFTIDPDRLASGVYYARLRTGSYVTTRPILIVK
jgi:hypothetical protein